MTGMNGWARFVGFKMLRLVSLLVGVSVLSFILLQFSPVDPIEAYIGGDMIRVSAEQRSLIEERWGLNESPMERLLTWGQALIQGDLGTSMIYRQPVADIIQERFMNSVALMAVAWILSGIIGFTLGVVAAMRRDSKLDRLICWYCYTLASTPVFWIALLLLMVFGVWLGWLPVGLGVPAGLSVDQVTWGDRAIHMILPALTLSLTGVASIALHTRQKLTDVLESDYILFARARGERGFQLFRRHGFRHVVLPAITLQFASFSELFGGAVLAEQVFSYPGLGQATVQAGLRGDVPLLLGLVMCSAIFVFTGNMVADILYRMIDPRMKEELMS
ncbi:ABC transporter permease [Paenibacillus sp. PAMC 26794]|uniref:ABC transporter permease n=1 Tax=Paenibacillus sp. PAMC 26794 TaxID=1257080 RepID=UPI0002D90D11|nr:ABC transporter permease [Paenibacillus sp. PAMC 26794]